jgi:outer membrane immunogenic protein
MRIVALLLAAGATLGVTGAASAQSFFGQNTSFRGFRLEGNFGGDRFQSEGVHNDKFGFGGTIGFDGQIGDKIVIGPEGTYWQANNWNENVTGGVNGGTVAHKSFEEYGAAVRAGYLFTPNLLVFGKAGWVTNDQRKSFAAPAGQTGFYNHTGTDGYQLGGGVEYTLPSFGSMPLPVYVSAQYVYSNYDDHTTRQRLMGGVGIRFK